MAETPLPDSSTTSPIAENQEEPHQLYANAYSPARPPIDRSAREATELARVRSNYTRVSSFHHGSSVASKQPNFIYERCIYGLKAFWRRQISVTVEHSTCRDHLGACLISS